MRSPLIAVLLGSLLASVTVLAASLLTGSLRIFFLLILGMFMLTLAGQLRNILLYFLGFILGPLMESIGIALHQWTYAEPQLLGFPYWLPFVWGNAALYLLLVKNFTDSFFKKPR